MIPWDCENRGLVTGIRFVKFIHVVLLFAERINYVAEVIKERWVVGERRALHFISHVIRHVLLRSWIVCRTSVTSHVKDDFAGLLNIARPLRQNTGKIHPIRRVLSLLVPVMETATHPEWFMRTS